MIEATYLIALVSADAISRLVFGALGQTPAEAVWKYVLALYINLEIAGTGVGLQTFTLPSIAAWLAKTLSAAATGGLLGFYCAGTLTGQQPQFAIAGAFVGTLALAIIKYRAQKSHNYSRAGSHRGNRSLWFGIPSGTTAIAFLSAAQVGSGLILAGFSFLYLWLTLRSFLLIGKTCRDLPGASFRGAVLTRAQFDGAAL